MTSQSQLSWREKHLMVSGDLTFTTVTALYKLSLKMLKSRFPTVIDLSGIADADSAGLSLLLEWASWAKKRQAPFKFVGMPSQLRRLARLSDADQVLQV